MKITLHTNELKPTTLAAIVADMMNAIETDITGYTWKYNALTEAYKQLDAIVGQQEAAAMIMDAGGDPEASIF